MQGAVQAKASPAWGNEASSSKGGGKGKSKGKTKDLPALAQDSNAKKPKNRGRKRQENEYWQRHLDRKRRFAEEEGEKQKKHKASELNDREEECSGHDQTAEAFPTSQAEESATQVQQNKASTTVAALGQLFIDLVAQRVADMLKQGYLNYHKKGGDSQAAAALDAYHHMSAAQKQDFLERFKGSKQKNGRPVLSEVVELSETFDRASESTTSDFYVGSAILRMNGLDPAEFTSDEEKTNAILELVAESARRFGHEPRTMERSTMPILTRYFYHHHHGINTECGTVDKTQQEKKHEKGSKFVTMLLENKGGVDTWTPLVDQARTALKAVLKLKAKLHQNLTDLQEFAELANQKQNSAAGQQAHQAATLLGDFVKELTTKVVAAHVLLEKTPEEIGDDRVKKVSDLRDDFESFRKAAVQHLGASRSKCNMCVREFLAVPNPAGVSFKTRPLFFGVE